MVEEVRKINANVIDLWSEKYHSKEQVGNDRCSVCGRKTSLAQKGLGVIVGDGGFKIIHPADSALEREQDGAGYMGWWAVGSECIKKVPKEFRTQLGK